ncbi:putative IGR protein [Septoria linicola]|nr:putative IGR protein [Septoria linicola]
MALRRALTLLQLPATLRPQPNPATTCLQCRSLHALNKPSPQIPRPTAFVPDVPTFLTLIGRGMSKHESKIPSWEALFTLSSEQLRESGLEPARARRYLLWWRERFRQGIYGIGGDVKHATKVGDKVAAELRIVEVPKQFKTGEERYETPASLTRDAGFVKVISNTRPQILEKLHEAGAETGKRSILDRLAPPPKVERKEVSRVKGMKIVRANMIGGTGIEYVKGYQGVAVLKVKEGLWEQRRGHKVDGGERRRAEVRAKRAAAERKNAR